MSDFSLVLKCSPIIFIKCVSEFCQEVKMKDMNLAANLYFWMSVGVKLD